MHAARRKAIRELLLDDVDLGNRRLTIGGRVRPIDELTRQILLEWLSYRSARWPGTANPHLLINQMSANGTGPVSTIYFAKTALRGQAATWNGSVSIASSRKPSPAGPTPCTWPRCSASIPRQQSATRRTPGSCSSRRPKNMPPATSPSA